MVRCLMCVLVALVGLGSLPAMAQEEPECGETEVTFCATKTMLELLGYCAVAPLGADQDLLDCLDHVCAGTAGDPTCCEITITVGPVDGCPDDPRPCPVGVFELINRLAESDNITWNPLDPESSTQDALEEICAFLANCCATSEFSGDGITRDDAVNAFYYFFPDSDLTEGDLHAFFDGCAGGASCPDNPGPPDGPVDPPVWPNGVIPTDGPPREPGVDTGGANRGGRCEGIALTGSPSFEDFANDPAECAGGSSIGIFDIDMYSGKWAKQSIDLALPAKGFGWVISRTYNGAQQVEDSGDYDFVHSNGMQGYDWRQDSLPELVINSTDGALYLVMNAQSYLTFGQYEDDSGSDLWVPNGSKGGAAVRSVNTDGTVHIEVFEVFDLTGLKMTFFGFDGAIDTTKQGQLWKMEDPAGNVAYIGHETLPDTALSTGFVEVGTSSGNYAVSKAYDTSGRLYEYEYSSNIIDIERNTGMHRLESITAYPSGVNTDPYVAKVEYEYYDWLTWSGTSGGSTAESNGLPGDLKLVRVSTPTSIGTEDIVERTHYRYWKDADTDGFDHAIKYIYDSEGLRRADIELIGPDGDHRTDDVLSETLADMKVYAAQYMEYNATTYDRRIKKVWGNGECGCGGTSASADGTYTLTYEGFTGIMNPGESGWQPWYTRTMIEYPLATPSEPNATVDSLEKHETIYFGMGGSKMATVITDDAPSTATNAWVTLTEFDYASLGAAQYTPAAISDYDHSGGTFTKASSGLVYTYIPWTLEDAIEDDTGDLIDDRNYGRTRFVAWKDGTAANVSDYLSETEQEFTEFKVWEVPDLIAPHDSASGYSTILSKPFTKRTRRYPEGGTTANASGYEETTIVNDFFAGILETNDPSSLRPEWITVNQPGVATDENGNGTTDYDPTTTYYRLDGTASWVKEADGIFSYTKYDDFDMPSWSIQDANPAHAEVSGDLPSVTLTATGVPLHIKTVYEYDDQMRMTTMLEPHGRESYEHYDVLDNGLIVNLSFPRYESAGTPLVYGPASFSLSGHNGASYQGGTLALDAAGKATSGTATWVDSIDADAIDAFDALGDLARLSETVYDEPGAKAVASRVYYDIDGTTGNQYDETTYAYDDRGRAVRSEAPHGTVTRTTFDDLGRTVAQWMGTNDSDFPGISGSGDNMIQIFETEYDNGGVGNHQVSESTQFVNATAADNRITAYTYDVRDRLIILENPESPHTVIEYDNLNRSVYSASYSDVSNATFFNADTKPSTLEDNRLSLSQTNYDTRGRVFESRIYEVDQVNPNAGSLVSSGAVYLFSKIWFSDVGQIVKATGTSIRKTSYDRLRRPVTRYFLSSVDESDTAYADAGDVIDDSVIRESHSLWDNESGLMLAVMTICRHPEDTATLGALFTPGSTPSLWEESANLKGRVEISAMWYDDNDRLLQSVDYGTAGLDSDPSDSESFDRLESAFDTAPTPMDLVGTTEIGHFFINAYNVDGEVEVVSVPNDETGEPGADWKVDTKTEYDDMGRMIQRIENWNGDTSPTPALPDINLITNMTYTDGLLTKQVVKNAKDTGSGTVVDSLETLYEFGTVYGVSNSDVSTGHLLQSEIYPDSIGSSDSISYEYNALGQPKQTTDQAGNTIEIDFDKRGRITSRRVENLDVDFDGYVQRIDTGYDSRGLVDSVEQYSAASGGTLRDSVELEYDNWGLLKKSSQNPDNTTALEVDYSTAWSLGQVSTVRRTNIEYPSGAKTTFSYGTFGSIDYNLSRINRVDFDYDGAGGVTGGEYANYTYGGSRKLLRTVLNTSGSQKYCSYYDPADSDGYAYLDEFNRPTKSFWAHDTGSDLKFYDSDLEYDVASNTVRINDLVTGHDQTLTVDDFRRLTGSYIGSSTQDWEYDHLGNWQSYEYEQGNGGSLEILDKRIFNLVNEITDRDLTIGGVLPAVAMDPVYDEVGNMTEDGRYYDYEYDAFGRITEVTDSATSNVVAEYKYNGLFHRTITRTDADNSGSLDSEEYHHVYDDRRRVVEIYRKPMSGSRDSEPKEATLYHTAGVNGSSSALDSVIARFRSDDDDVFGGTPEADWSAQADGEMNLITWYFQNWRGDVVFIHGHGTSERIEYTPYGTPKGYGAGDQNTNGAVDALDYSSWIVNFNNGNALGDVNFDGSVAATDYSAWLVEFNTRGGTVGGAGVLSPWLDSHIGYAGYRLTDQVLTTVWHVRFRELVPELGLWTKRDPIGYRGGQNLYGYVNANPIESVDPMGLLPSPKCTTGCGGGNSGTRRVLPEGVYWIQPEKEEPNKTPVEKDKEEDDYHAKRGIYFQYTIVCTDKDGKKTTHKKRGWAHDVNEFIGNLALTGCCVKSISVSAHHTDNDGVYAVKGDYCSNSVFSNNLYLCANASVVLKMCNSCDLARMICIANKGVPGVSIECTEGWSSHAPIDWWIWPWDGIDGTIEVPPVDYPGYHPGYRLNIDCDKYIKSLV